MIWSKTEEKSVVDTSKKSKFIIVQQVSGLLSSSGIKIPLNKNPWVGPLLP